MAVSIVEWLKVEGVEAVTADEANDAFGTFVLSAAANAGFPAVLALKVVAVVDLRFCSLARTAHHGDDPLRLSACIAIADEGVVVRQRSTYDLPRMTCSSWSSRDVDLTCACGSSSGALPYLPLSISSTKRADAMAALSEPIPALSI
jgi:hypothetical protein